MAGEQKNSGNAISTEELDCGSNNALGCNLLAKYNIIDRSQVERLNARCNKSKEEVFVKPIPIS
jgi:hypothetical protein